MSRAALIRRFIDRGLDQSDGDLESDLAAIEASFDVLSGDEDFPERGVDDRSRDVADLVAAYLQGVPVAELAESFQVNRTTVLGHVRRHGVPKRDRRALRQDDADKAVKLYADGRSAEWVAEEMHVSASTVRRALKDAGVVLRPPGRPRRRHDGSAGR